MSTTNPLADDLNHVLENTRHLWEELRGGRIFITGATGFFGCWFLETFYWANQNLRLNAQATILTRNPDRLKQQAPHLSDAIFDVVVGDVSSFAFPSGNFSHLIHAATESSVELNTKHPSLMFDTIVQGTKHCLEFASKAGVKKFLFTSSGAVYGKQPPDVANVPETYQGGPDPLNPQSAYASGKRAAELLCVLAVKQANAARGQAQTEPHFQPKIARCFAFVGPYMKLDAHFAIGNFIRDQLAGSPIYVNGDGSTVRSYMYASDLMIWLWTILFVGKSCEAYNVGSEEAISIADLATQVAGVGQGRTAIYVSAEPVAGAPIDRYVPSTARAQKELGLRSTVSLKSAIERTMQWNRTRNAQISAPPAGTAEVQTQSRSQSQLQ